MEQIEKLSKDLKEASRKISDKEARYLVDMYYQMQDARKTNDNRIRSIDCPVFYDEKGKKRLPTEEEIETSASKKEPHAVLDWFSANDRKLESEIKKALAEYSDYHPIGKWLKEITGIGDVIAAGLLAHIDITQCPTAGHIWSYCGYNPNRKWLGNKKIKDYIKKIEEDDLISKDEMITKLANYTGWSIDHLTANSDTKAELIKCASKRPFNSSLKTLCWKIGESFVKVSNNENDVYGKLYQKRKLYEQENNEKLLYADQAKQKLIDYKIDKKTDAYKAYIVGKLPPAHIQSRAKRWAVKMFISHLHEAWYTYHYKKPPPAPYPIAILGHAHKVEFKNQVTG